MNILIAIALGVAAAHAGSGTRTAIADSANAQVGDSAKPKGPAVPLTAAEVSQAVRLAFANKQVAALFPGRLSAFFKVTSGPPGRAEPGAAMVTALLSTGHLPTDPCSRARCAVLCFWVNDRYEQVNRVFVNLDTKLVTLR